MQTVDLGFMTIEDAALALVRNAPARGNFWGVEVRAKYATTNARDVIAQYNATIQARACSYWFLLPKCQRERMKCQSCGAVGCKMWREYNTCADVTSIFCGPCALDDQGKQGPIDAEGKIETDFGRCDQIGWLVPAVPCDDSFWGYTSVPAEGVLWWRQLPSYPERCS